MYKLRYTEDDTTGDWATFRLNSTYFKNTGENYAMTKIIDLPYAPNTYVLKNVSEEDSLYE